MTTLTVLICNTLRMSYNCLPEDIRYPIKMLVSEPNHALVPYILTYCRSW